MFKLGKMTDYATVLMTALASAPAERRSAQDLADFTHVSAPTVAKLLRQLSTHGLVTAERGQHGGYRLTRAPNAITIADVVSAVEGPLALTECSVHDGSGCSIESHCGVRTNWRLINTAIQQALASVTLEDMATPPRSAPRPPNGASNEVPLVRMQRRPVDAA
jgi:FeS assembly SUF system regulator